MLRIAGAVQMRVSRLAMTPMMRVIKVVLDLAFLEIDFIKK